MKFKELRTSFLTEAMSQPMTMRDVKAIEKKYNEKMSQDEIDEYLENNFNPSNSARPDAWLSLGYPVRNGDYYFALIGKRKGKNIKDNQRMNDQLKKMKKLYDDPDALYDNFMDWCYENVKDSGVGDTMTREEIWAACLHIMKMRVATVYVKEEIDTLDEGFFKRLFRKLKRGIRNLKPKGVPKESVKEGNVYENKIERDIQKAVKIAMDMGGNMTGAYKKIERIKRGLGDHPVVKNALRLANESMVYEMEMKQIRRKYGKDLRTAMRKGSLEIPQDAEEALYQWAFDNGEVKTDDPDEFINWLDNNLDDIVRGKLD